MKKPVAITIACLFSITVLLPGAYGGSDCKVKCDAKMAKAHLQAAMGSTRLAAANCCFGAMKSTCQMAGAPEIKIPQCSITNRPVRAPDPASIGLLSMMIDPEALGTSRHVRQPQTGPISKTPLLYLQTLSLRC